MRNPWKLLAGCKAAAILLNVAALAAFGAGPAGRPNVVLILTDDKC
ncbi:MAG: hypothetical protein HY000_28605 [Planctomycetes bacterium]|nr:hypothetical protein [Planctomycetota bacterium]